MIGPFFSVGPCKQFNIVIDGSTTITSWVQLIQAILISCNWTTVSTFVGFDGTLGINMRTFPTPNHQTAILTLFWDGSSTPFSGNAIMTFEMSDSTLHNTAVIGLVSLNLGKTFSMILGPHQFFIFSTESGAFQFNYAMGGVPVTLGNKDCYWGIGDGGTFGGAPSFTNTLAATTGEQGFWAYLLNGVAVTRTTAGSNLPLQLLVQRNHTFQNDPLAFADGTVPVIEPILLLLENTAVYLWDAIVASTEFLGNLQFNFRGQLFWMITLNFSLGSLGVVAQSATIGSIGGYSY